MAVQTGEKCETSRREWEPGSHRARFSDLALAGLAALAIGWTHRNLLLETGRLDSVREVVDAAIYDPTLASPALGLAVFGTLMLKRRGALVDAFRSGRPLRLLGSAVLALGIGLIGWSNQIDADQLRMPALILHLAGAALLLGGARMLRTVALPLLALALAAPLPATLVNQVVFPLQLWTAALTSLLLDGIGQDHTFLGDLIVKDGVTFQVVEGCSGLKSTLSLGLAAILYADLTVRRGVQKALLLAIVPGLGLLLNVVRVTLLVLGEIPAESIEHAAIGIAMIVGGVVVLAVLEVVLTKTVFRSDAPLPGGDVAAKAESGITAARSRRIRIVATAVIVAACGVAATPRGSWPAPRPAISIESLPESLEGWRGRPLRADRAFLGSVWFQHRIYRVYEREDESIRVFIGHDDLTRPGRSGYSPKTAIPGSGWLSIRRTGDDESTTGNADARLGGGGAIDRLIVDYPQRRTLVMHWRIGYAPWGLDLVERWFGWHRLAHAGQRISPLVVRIESDVRGPEGEARTWMILRQFADRLDEWSTTGGAAWKNAQYLRRTRSGEDR
ncbi:MAG: exosortase/archaeosortase family protein [Myxococcota bacterium]